MRLKLTEPGYAVSGGLHVVVLILLLVSLPRAEEYDPMQETVPIETVSDSEFNQVMHGDKSAEKVVPEAAQAEQASPAPPTPEVQTPATPPPPPPPLPPVAQQVPQPPVRAPDPPPPPTPPERVDPDAEPVPAKVAPTPPRPPERVVEAKPQPPVRPKPTPKPPKPDQLAKLIEDTPDDKPVAKPRPQPTPKPQADAEPQEHTFDLTDISKLLSGSSAPAAKASTGQAQTKVASLGSQTAHASKMAPTLWGQLDGLMEEQYRQCWSYLGLASGQKYIPQIKVTYDETGGLSSDPVLINPPSDPGLRSLAESALRAVRRCNPMKIPVQYAPYYDEWKGRVLRFDPQQMAG